jgi:hypothetical protein
VESVKIILLCVSAAVVYGIAQDQVTARVCVEYFTIGHPPVFDTDSPTLLAFGWGVLATWWVGLPLGIAGAVVSHVGSWPKFSARQLMPPILCLMAAMGPASLLAGVIGYFVARSGAVWLLEPLASRVPASKHDLFLADLWAHVTAYGAGFVGGIVVCGYILFRRSRITKSMA